MIYVTSGAWGAGNGGVPLFAAEIDQNFYELRSDLDGVIANPPVGVGISDISVAGTAMTVTLTNLTELGPFPLPVLLLRWRGIWRAGVQYEVLDWFDEPGVGMFSVLIDHLSAGTFDPDAVGATENAGSFTVDRTYLIASVGTTDFTAIGAESNTVGVEFRATGVGSGTGTATPKLYHRLSGADTTTTVGDLADVRLSGSPEAAAENDFLVWSVSGSPATGAWENKSPTQVTALLDVFAGDTGSPGVGGVKGLVPAPADGDAAAGKVLGAGGGWVIASTVGELDDLTDVESAGAVAGQVLKAAGSPILWMPGYLALDELSDVATGGVVAGQVLKAGGSPISWAPGTLALNDMTDVTLTSPADDSLLQFNSGSGQWEDVVGAAISGLSDVALPLDPGSLLLVSDPTGSPPTYASGKITARDLRGYYRLEAPASGATVVLNPEDAVLVVNPAAAIAALTVTMPAAVDRHRVKIATRQRIDALTIAGTDWPGGELPAKGAIELLYVSSLTTWVLI